MSDEVEYGLVMPFVACQSQGGPYDDESYVAGFEVGALDAVMRYTALLEAQGFAVTQPIDDQLFHDGNQEQIDLIAMRHGYVVDFSDPVDGWMTASFRREAG